MVIQGILLIGINFVVVVTSCKWFETRIMSIYGEIVENATNEIKKAVENLK